MTLDYDIQQQANQFFREEAPELLQVIEQELLVLAKDRTLPRVHSLMRAAHSLKGGAATVGLDSIKTVAHRLEDGFKGLYNQDLVLDSELEDLLFQGYDQLRALVTAEVDGQHIDERAVLQQSETIFVRIDSKLAGFQDHEAPLLNAADLGIDIVQSIFEVDIGLGLDHLAQAMESSQVAEELRTQAELFVGLGELSGLPGFVHLAETALKALDANPMEARAIAEIALVDFRAAQLAVLAGDRITGGAPSAHLQAFTQRYVASSHSTPGPEPSAEPSLPPRSLFSKIKSWWKGLFTATPLPTPKIHTPEPVSVADLFPIIAPRPLVKSVTYEAPINQSLSPAVEPIETTPASEELSEPDQDSLMPIDDETVALGQPAPLLLTLEDVFGDVSVAPVEFMELTDERTEAMADEACELLPVSFAEVPALFDQLPPASDLIPPVSEPLSPSLPPRLPQTNPANRPTVRVELERMDRLNNLIGELVINRNGLSLQNEQIQGALGDLLERFEDFRKVGRQLQNLSDRLLVNPTRPQQPSFLKGFDSLEMDSYSSLHSLLQEAMEHLGDLEETTDNLSGFAQRTNQTLENQRRMLTSLRDDLMWARMLPLAELFNRFPRLLRDLSTTYNKPMELIIGGADILVDKAAFEKLYDPLLHLVRNAFDHGLESEEVRRQQQKPPTGKISLLAYHRGSQTVIEVRDDGRGLDLDNIRTKAINMGIATENSPPAILQAAIFAPGFSTAKQVSELSGRGVGLDVVRSQLQGLKGSVAVSSTPGAGTTFTLRIPLTLTVAKLLVFRVGEATYAVALDEVVEILIPHPNQVKTAGGKPLLFWREQLIPLCPFQEVLTYNSHSPRLHPNSAQSLAAVVAPLDWAKPVLILRGEGSTLALEIDQLITEQELVIKPFDPLLAPPIYFYGCTILGDGTLVPVLNGLALVEQILETPEPILPSITAPMSTKAATILVVDDSLVQRKTLDLTLQQAGYHVIQAKDGQEALEQLQEKPGIQLVICDIEMPRMNGFEFLAQRQQQPELSTILVAMLSSRASEKHRALAKELGAAAYLTKPFDRHELTETVSQLLQNSHAS